MKATENGSLKEIKDCYVEIKGSKIYMNSLPDLSDSKSAVFNDETAIGRSTPIKTFAHSDARQISLTIHMYGSDLDEIDANISHLANIESAVYPQKEFDPFSPPPICKIKCGRTLTPGYDATGEPLCVILKSYSIKFPREVVWVDVYGGLFPVQFDVDTTWEVVYASSDLPGQERIFSQGR